MKILSQCALVSALFIPACATPLEIKDDVLPVDPSSFGDAGPSGAGNGGSSRGGGAGLAGRAGVAQGGTGAGLAGTGSGQAGAGVGGQTAGGFGGTGAGAGGTTAGNGAGGAAAGAGAGGAGAGGTGAQGTFTPSSCSFDNQTGCEAFGCQNCPANSGSYCADNCPPIIQCVLVDNLGCSTAQDPLCGARTGNTGNACLAFVESFGGDSNPPPGSPAFVARELVNCVCTVPRPIP
jgi:hypothetical protein